MENEFLILESKLEQLLGVVSRLQTRNAALTAQLETTHDENQQLRATVAAAKDRVAQLIASIPEECDNPEGDEE